jgi:hypothetical protein
MTEIIQEHTRTGGGYAAGRIQDVCSDLGLYQKSKGEE